MNTLVMLCGLLGADPDPRTLAIVRALNGTAGLTLTTMEKIG